MKLLRKFPRCLCVSRRRHWSLFLLLLMTALCTWILYACKFQWQPLMGLIKGWSWWMEIGNTLAIDPTRLPEEKEVSRWIIMQAKSRGGDLCNQALSLFPGWNVLLFGVAKVGISHSRCYFLSPDEINKFKRLHSLDSYEADSIELGYLYLMERQADAIYLAPTLHLDLSQDFIMTHTSLISKGLVYLNPRHQSIVNISQHFGCSAENTPFGSAESFDISPQEYKLCNFSTSLPLQTPLSQIEILPSNDINKQQLIACDQAAPPVVIPENTFVSDTSLHGAVFLSEAFWALPFYNRTLSTYDRVWSLMVQKLLWYKRRKLLVWHNKLNKNSLRYQKDNPSKDENIVLHNKMKQVVRILMEWECQNDLFACAVDMAAELASQNLIHSSFVLSLKKWFLSLQTISFTFSVSEVEESCQDESVFYHSLNYNQFLPKKKGPLASHFYKPVMNLIPTRQLIQTYCTDLIEPNVKLKINLTAPWQQFSDVLLIIIFNKPHYETIPILEAIYRPFYPHILYCGPHNPNTTSFPQLLKYHINFVSYGETPEGHMPGSFNYRCLASAIQMNFDIKGYLVIADDVLLMLKQLNHLQPYSLWFLPKKEIRIGEVTKLRECRLGMCDFHPHWRWWEDYQGATLSLLARFQHEKDTSKTVEKCQKHLEQWTGSSSRALGSYSDIFYLPARLKDDFEQLAMKFLEENVFLEIAVPSILGCLEPWSEVGNLLGILDWERKGPPWSFYDPKTLRYMSYIHPVKWGYLANQIDDKYRTFLCQKVLPNMHNPYSNLG